MRPAAFTRPTNLITVLQGTPLVTVSNFVTNLRAGPTNETGQTLAFVVTSTNISFSAKPTITTNGVLKFQTAATSVGDAIVQVALQDNGGTANGGTNRSPVQTFIIHIEPNLLIPLKGSYNGLFYETAEIHQESSGYFTFSLTDKGTYSGALMRNRITSVSGSAAGLTLTNKASIGFVSGSFYKPGTTARITIRGVIFQQQTNAHGYFLGTNASGTFLLQ